MAASYLTPGVYVEEVTAKSATLSAGATAVAAFVGFTEKAPPDRPEEPQLVTNWTQFEKLYGGFTKGAMLPHAVYGYFLNGGSVAYIVRIPHTAPATESGTLALTSGDKSIKAAVQFRTKEPNADVTVRITKEPDLPALPSAVASNGNAPAPSGDDTETAADGDDAAGSDGAAGDGTETTANGDGAPGDGAETAADGDGAAGDGTNADASPAIDPGAPSYTIEIIAGPAEGDQVGTTETFTGVQLGNISDRLNKPKSDAGATAGDATADDASAGDATAEEATAEEATADDASADSGDAGGAATPTTATAEQPPKFSNFVDVQNTYDLGKLDKLLQTLPEGEHRIQPATGDPLDNVPASSFAGSESARTGINGLSIADDVTMVIVPDLVTAATKNGTVDETLWKTVQIALVNHCEGQGNRMALLDTPPSKKSPQAVKAWREEVGYSSAYGALYYPWIEVDNPAAEKNDKPTIMVPPSGHMAGIWARTDDTRGVWKAPANEVVRGALSVETPVNSAEQGQLNPIGVNCIRPLGTQGIRVWGARTLADPTGEWVYINVRRLFNMIEHTILTGTNYAVFEPNDQELWEGLKRTVGSFLRGLWRDGALFGATAEQAFYVKCDEETNPPESIDQGRVIVEVGIAPVKPAEFVIFRIAQIKAES